jgi:hypothetical protein
MVLGVMSVSAESTVREPVPTGCIVRIDVGPILRLPEMVGIDAAIRRAMGTDPIRVVIDARNLESMTVGAYLALVGATIRLERAGIELVVEHCPASMRHTEHVTPADEARARAG